MDVRACRDLVLSGDALNTALSRAGASEGGGCVTRCCWNRSDSSRDSVVNADADIEAPIAAPVEPERNPEDLAIELRWRQLVEQGELDVYTCLSLRNSCEEYDGQKHELDWDTFRTVVILLALQVVVPALMLLHQVKHMPSYAVDNQVEFRIIGFVLFLYSIRNMYGNALSECRELYLHRAYQGLPLRYVWPAILGEVVNSWCAFILCITLYTVFCGAVRLPELLINCISINFIGNVDEEFVSDDLKLKASDNFHKNMEIIRASEPVDPKSIGRSRQLLDFFLYATRVGGTLCLGTLLAFIFLLSHEPFICTHVALAQTLGLC